jgi:hypothetical protein
MDFISRGSEAKYRLEITTEDFNMGTDDFGVRLLWGLRGQTLAIEKSAMTVNGSGEWFFTFDTTEMFGQVRVVCWCMVHDGDTGTLMRQESDAVLLCLIRAKDACSVDDGLVDDGCGCPAHYSNERGGCNFGIWLCASEEEEDSGSGGTAAYGETNEGGDEGGSGEDDSGSGGTAAYGETNEGGDTGTNEGDDTGTDTNEGTGTDTNEGTGTDADEGTGD